MDQSGERATAPSWLSPTVENDLYVWRRGDLEVAVSPGTGARLTKISLGGRNVLTGPEVNAQNYGSTIWTAPQAIWDWPPPVELDERPYAAELEAGTGRLICRGPTSQRLGVAFTKEFALDAATGALVMRTTAENRVGIPTKLALWEISRVRTGGLTFFPKGEGIFPPSKLVVEEHDGVVWFLYDAASIVEHQKLFADGSEGWLGHVDGELLLVKTFPKVPRREQAPGEAEIELYADPGHTYVEVEQQGPYVLLPPFGRTSWEVRWLLARLPAGTAVTPGSALASFARGLAATIAAR